MTRALAAVLTILLLCQCTHPATALPVSENTELRWEPFTKASFERAARERKLLLISVQAGWCHWCHVMNATTYRDPRVIALLSERFVVLRVDQDSRPDLAERYADWGWPATGLLTPNARTIVNLRGHQPADRFLALLQELVDELDHGGALAPRQTPPALAAPRGDLEAVRADVLAQLETTYDAGQGGWGAPQKYPLAAPVEDALFRLQVLGEGARKDQVERSLQGYAQLIDPVAGGMFQYSLRGVWTQPHYEKIAPIQAGAMRAFSLAYRATGDASFRRAAERVAEYVLTVLRAPSGAFYASQDADVGRPGDRDHLEGADYYKLNADERAVTKAPQRDEHVYANLNGMLIRALCDLGRATGDERAQRAAEDAAEAVEALRTGDSFRHEASDSGEVRYLSDQVELAAAFDALADLSGKARYRLASDKLLDYVQSSFLDREFGGLFAHTPDPNAVGDLGTPAKPYADNALAARLLLRRAQRTWNDGDRETGLALLRALSDPQRIRDQGRMIGDYLLALDIALSARVMFSVVGPPDDPRTQALAAACADIYAPNALVQVSAPDRSHYPYPGEPAVYLCSDTACSSPISQPGELASAFAAFVAD